LSDRRLYLPKKIRDPIQSERGAALLMAMLAIVLMSVIGLVLLNIVRSGFVQSAAAEGDIQAEAYAQSGLDEALAIIRSKVEQANSAGATKRAKAGVSIASLPHGIIQRDRYKFQITTGVLHDPNTEGFLPSTLDYPYVQELSVVSTGETEGIPLKRTVTKTMTVMVSNIDPVFRYPVSAERRMDLNGAVSIIGDVRVGNSANNMQASAEPGLHSSSNAKYIINGPALTQSTSFPSLKGFVHVVGPGTAYYYKNTAAVNPHPFTRDDFAGDKPFEDKKLGPSAPIGISAVVEPLARASEFQARLDQAPLASVLPESFDAIELGTGSASGVGVLSGKTGYVNQWITVKGALAIDEIFTIKEGFLKTETGSVMTLNNNGSIYAGFTNPDPDLVAVAADLSGTVQGMTGKMITVSGNTVLRNFTFLNGGTIFVKGNLQIIGDLKFDGSIYVDGSVDLKEMNSINQGPLAGRPVIIMASKNIQMSDNLTVNYANPNAEQRVRAFLYSETGDLKMYGVLSNLFIEGGIHGGTVELNAVKGETNWNAAGTGIDFEDQTLPGLRSRLRIYYDPTIYANPPAGIPTTDNITVFVQHVAY
jgi:hypothetical protein